MADDHGGTRVSEPSRRRSDMNARAHFTERWDGVYERTLLWSSAFRGEEGVRVTVRALRCGS
jgi:hypothetical protein